MAMRADDLIDRRRLRRKLTFWRVAALAIAAVGVAAAAGLDAAARISAAPPSDHIAKVRIEGTITEDEELLERLEKIRKSSVRQGRDPGDRFAGRHHRRRRGDLRRGAGSSPPKSRSSRRSARSRHRPAT